MKKTMTLLVTFFLLFQSLFGLAYAESATVHRDQVPAGCYFVSNVKVVLGSGSLTYSIRGTKGEGSYVILIKSPPLQMELPTGSAVYDATTSIACKKGVENPPSTNRTQQANARIKETNCADGKDNDGNGKIDCYDNFCKRDQACANIPEEETNCADGIDEDYDMKIDCADIDCQPRSSGGPGVGRNSSECEISESSCGDGFDNDGDGGVDCMDIDCHELGFCSDSTSTIETSCYDNIDDDGDGKVDCNDEDCPIQGYCLPVEEGNAVCQDDLDNDGDGKTDCEEVECGGVSPACSCRCESRGCDEGFTCDSVGRPENDQATCGCQYTEAACGNGVCDNSYENERSCPVDCQQETTEDGGGGEEGNQEEDPLCPQGSDNCFILGCNDGLTCIDQCSCQYSQADSCGDGRCDQRFETRESCFEDCRMILPPLPRDEETNQDEGGGTLNEGNDDGGQVEEILSPTREGVPNIPEQMKIPCFKDSDLGECSRACDQEGLDRDDWSQCIDICDAYPTCASEKESPIDEVIIPKSEIDSNNSETRKIDTSKREGEGIAHLATCLDHYNPKEPHAFCSYPYVCDLVKEECVLPEDLPDYPDPEPIDPTPVIGEVVPIDPPTDIKDITPPYQGNLDRNIQYDLYTDHDDTNIGSDREAPKKEISPTMIEMLEKEAERVAEEANNLANAGIVSAHISFSYDTMNAQTMSVNNEKRTNRHSSRLVGLLMTILLLGSFARYRKQD